jgi:hypothetical protein
MANKKTNKMLTLLEKFADEVGLEKRIEVDDDSGNITFNATFNMEIEGFKDELPFILYLVCSNDPGFILAYLYIDTDDFNIPKNKLAKAFESVNEINQSTIYGRFCVIDNSRYQFLKPLLLEQAGVNDYSTGLIHTIVSDCQSAYKDNFSQLTSFFK